MNYKEKKILILDDNPEILEMVQESLNIAGFSNLTSVQSQKEALEQFEEKSFDLVILDIMLPEGSGFEVLKVSVRLQRFLFCFCRQSPI